jgi:hypothetical protein
LGLARETRKVTSAALDGLGCDGAWLREVLIFDLDLLVKDFVEGFFLDLLSVLIVLFVP